ncbi:sel1 repeat family protein [Thalassotalea sp. M1531]|uniref:Sel1 repeat family protein n=1 Tax=Thalassotalea algicola TaxID=2716224 RepID=A0A7Y0LF20_9GAMM|nr:tetratricopeptide repeat protein [Thalassotalea algicola]NMP31975.1 sel1 repeat family protein [Thalassotalea algicola]
MRAVTPILLLMLVVFATSTQAKMKVEPCETDRCKDYFTHFKMSAKRGHAESTATLAEFYYHGFGITKNLKLAHKYYKKAAKLGVVRSQYKLALLYLNNDHFGDLEQGVKYLKRAAYNDHPNAPYLLGAIYYSDRFGEHDKLEADKWLAQAYRGGHKDMPAFIGHILSFEELSKNQFPHLYSAIKKKPLVTTAQNTLAWPPEDGTEVITVRSPNIDTLLRQQMAAARKQTKHLGSRMPGVDCQTAVACKALTHQEMADRMDIVAGPIAHTQGVNN